MRDTQANRDVKSAYYRFIEARRSYELLKDEVNSAMLNLKDELVNAGLMDMFSIDEERLNDFLQ